MGRKRLKNKKTPGDYPQFAFRLSAEDKFRLADLVEEVHSHLNEKRREGDSFISKGDVIVAALYKGLRTLKR